MTGLLYFLPISLVIALVLSALKKDSPRDILLHGLKVFLLLAAGTAAFSALLFVCARTQAMLFGFMGVILATLGFFTLKGAAEWVASLVRGEKPPEEKQQEED